LELDVFSEKGRDRQYYARVPFDESPVKVGESKEDLDIVDRGGCGPIGDGSNAFWVHCYSVWGNDETEEAGFGDMKLTLLKLDKELALLKTLEDFSDTLDVLFQRTATIDQYVVHICDTEEIEVFVEGVIDV